MSVCISGDRLPCSLADFKSRCEWLIEVEQQKALPDSALIAVLCDAVRLARENERLIRSVLEERLAK